MDAVAKRYALAGEVLVARGDRVLLDRGYGPIAPAGGALHQAGERWRLASITKQVTAALAVKQFANRPLALETPISFISVSASPGQTKGPATATLRQLMTHHSGLANPDTSTPGADGVPAFYLKAEPDLAFCTTRAAVAGAPFSYNNCDYILLDGPIADLTNQWPAGMAMARPDEIGVPGFVGGRPEPRFQLASWGAAGGLMGTAKAVFAFDRSLMTGALVPPAVRDGELWKPEGHGSYQALGAWAFPGQLAGCAAPKQIVQRDGEIFGVQARNFILPDDDLVVIVFTNRSADDFPVGEVWQGRGFAYDLLSAAAC